MKFKKLSQITLLCISSYLYADYCNAGVTQYDGSVNYNYDGTCSLGEYIDIKEISSYNIQNNSVELIYNKRAWRGSHELNSIWNQTSYDGNLSNISSNRNYNGITLPKLNYYNSPITGEYVKIWQKGGLAWCDGGYGFNKSRCNDQTQALSSGFFGAKKAINSNDDILFTVIPYRSKANARTSARAYYDGIHSNLGKCTDGNYLNKNCVVGDDDFESIVVGPFDSKIATAQKGDVAFAFKLNPYYTDNTKNSGRWSEKRFLVNLEGGDVSVRAYVQERAVDDNYNGKYIPLSNRICYKDKQMNKNVCLNPNEHIKMLDNTKDIKTIPFLTAYGINDASGNKVTNKEYEEKIIYPSLYWLKGINGSELGNWKKRNARTMVNYAVQTFKKCKEPLLYEIQIHAIKVKGERGIYHAYNDGVNLGTFWTGYQGNRLVLPELNYSYGGQLTEIGTREYDQFTDFSEPAVFFVLQDGSKDEDAIECLPTPQANINTAWLKNTSSYDNFTFKNTTVGDGVYTILNGDTTYIRLDFTNANKSDLDEHNKPRENPFVSDENRYISINVGDINNIKNNNINCVNDKLGNAYNGLSRKYFRYQYDKSNSPNEISSSVDLRGYQGVSYKDMCKFLNERNKNKADFIPCNENDTSRANEIFYKYADATIRFNCLSTSAEDKARREFELRFYRDINNIASKGKIIKHIPITVRAESINLNIYNCDIFSRCYGKNEQTNQQISKFPSIYFDDNSNISKFLFTKFQLKVPNSKNTKDYYFNLAFDSANPMAMTYNNNRSVSATGVSNNLTIINPFAGITNRATVVILEEHIRKYLENYLDNNPEFENYTVNNSCINSDEMLDKNTANKAINHKIYCQTPLNEPIKLKEKGVVNSIKIKSNIDKDARANAFITSNPSEFKYRIYPQLISTATNISVPRYFSDDMILKLGLNFINEYNADKLELNFDDTFDNSKRAYDGSTKNEIKLIKEDSKRFYEIKISKDSLNQYFDYALEDACKELKCDTNGIKTTSHLINDKKDYSYQTISDIYIDDSALENKRIAAASDNAAEIPLSLTYNKKQQAFTLASIDIFLEKAKNPTYEDLKQSENVNVNFISATPLFKDIKINNNIANITQNDVWLHYIDEDGILKPFGYFYTKSNKDKFKDAISDDKKTITCSKTPCYRVKDEIPGLNKTTNYISDYQSKISRNADGSLKVILNNKLQYIKDTVHCYGGLFDCDSRWTIEYQK